VSCNAELCDMTALDALACMRRAVLSRLAVSTRIIA